MVKRKRYFVFNKEADFRKSYNDNMTYDPNGLRLLDQKDANGSFFSRVLDSTEQETRWHRIVVTSKDLGDATIRFRFYSSESPYITTEDGAELIEDVLQSTSWSKEEKERLTAAYLRKTVLNPKDILLHEVTGRYLWMCIEFFGQNGVSPIISHMKVYLEKENWLTYLPEVYQTGSSTFLERYLYLFQTCNQQMEEQIEDISLYFNPEIADEAFLAFLGEWISLDDTYIWKEDQLRYLILNGMQLYQLRGTREYLERLLELYLGVKPYIIENFELKESKEDIQITNLIEKLYGDSPYQFTVVVNEDQVPTTKEYKTLLKIIDSAKPAHMEANVVVLKPYLFLDKYTYLGMNSALGKYKEASLDGFSALSFASVSGDRTIEEKREDE